MTIAGLHHLLDEIDTQGGPEAARQWCLTIPDTEKGPDPMAHPSPVTEPPSRNTAATEPAISVGQLLKWGEDHDAPDVRDQAARARMALTGLRRRYAADQELAALTSEREQLEKRLAELLAREAELTATRPKKKRSSYVRDYDTRKVRAWAAENGVDCPRVGQIPKRVLDAWRTSLPQAR
ncbi:histone-like nucleoid-structuring protein Lsr2 [Streptomyces sp. NPDC001750]|uniref:Lsr2 family DNA-binding protein n=1 Tax=Streptomyces sp. NPDC001750 TaxID=3364607 RepID=UPI0036B5D024